MAKTICDGGIDDKTAVQKIRWEDICMTSQ